MCVCVSNIPFVAKHSVIVVAAVIALEVCTRPSLVAPIIVRAVGAIVLLVVVVLAAIAQSLPWTIASLSPACGHTHHSDQAQVQST